MEGPHRYHPRVMMDNAAFERDANGGDMRTSRNGHGAAGAAATATTTVELGEFVTAPKMPLCKPDLCRAQAQGVIVKPPTMRPNPWHRYKTIFLVATVAGLVVWAIAYFALTRYGML